MAPATKPDTPTRYMFGQALQPPGSSKREVTRVPTERPERKEIERPAQGFNGPTPANKIAKWTDA